MRSTGVTGVTRVLPLSVLVWVAGGLIGALLSKKGECVTGALMGAVVVGAVGDSMIERQPWYTGG